MKILLLLLYIVTVPHCETYIGYNINIGVIILLLYRAKKT